MWQTCRCVLYRNGGRFVWKRKAFCMEMEGVLYQNGRRFDTKCIPFCHKTEERWRYYDAFRPKTRCVLGLNAACFGPKRRTIWAKTGVGYSALNW